MDVLEKLYDPKKVEKKWYEESLKKGYFQPSPLAKASSYTIVIPPPNVTGFLHMGHALNSTIQDVLVRVKRMQGDKALWVPGTDHAGIATQNVVEKSLKKQGKTKEDLGREAFVKEVWAWKEKHGNRIVDQLKKLGASCDWERERFTMDEGLSKAVRRCFYMLYEKGLVYRGYYIVNWCPRCGTALSDEESEHKELKGAMYHLRYALEGGESSGEWIEVATTRPETMFGDVAVAMNPNDERYKYLKGKSLILPILGKKIPVIEDEHVDPDFGTGLVKVTPAHDPNDFEMAKRHGLTWSFVMTDNAKMKNAGQYDGLDRFECREKLILDLKKQGILVKIESHMHSVGHCYRCDTIVEPKASKQWFVKMKPLAERALQAERDGKVSFYPKKWTKIYTEWLENIRDWCISRQIWWGHQIPVWYCDDCDEQTVELDDPEKCSGCGSVNIRQEQDVLDTWFSSWLWPFSSLGWPDATKDLEDFYPTQTLVTAPDILFFWVSRMIMAGLEFTDTVPFKRVYLHGVVRDDQGRKMSKSLGNAIDPLESVEMYSADALRFSLLMLAPLGQDVQLSSEKFVLGRNFANKIWNAVRFLSMNVDETLSEQEEDFSPKPVDIFDKWILSRLHRMIATVSESVEKFRFNDAVNCLYDFIWHDFCDWYVELIKSRIGEVETQKFALNVLNTSMLCLHPFMPFITEEIWHLLPLTKKKSSIVVSEWPELSLDLIDEEVEKEFSLIKDVIQSTRNVRRELKLPLNKELCLIVDCRQEQTKTLLEGRKDILSKFAKLSSLEIGVDFEKPADSRAIVRDYGTLYVSLVGLIDTDVEKKRLNRELEKVEIEISKIAGKLSNSAFMNKAPKEVVEKEIDRRKKYENMKQNLLDQLDLL
ncbi:valine--tRNA ligase [PVC group bacterium (ex Bugula neritina AB1)]|nr:valine--tRNA ligase [PVC group bacterium (ex Bugula neritina AB1)]